VRGERKRKRKREPTKVRVNGFSGGLVLGGWKKPTALF
jgi:hypothetical protein